MSLRSFLNMFSSNRRNRQIFGPSLSTKLKILGGIMLIIILLAVFVSIKGVEEKRKEIVKEEVIQETPAPEPESEPEVVEELTYELPEKQPFPENKTKEIDIDPYSEQCQLAIRDQEKDIKASEQFRERAYYDYEAVYQELVEEQEKLEEALEKVEKEKRKLELMVHNCDKGRLPY